MDKEREFLKAINELNDEEINDIVISIYSLFTSEYAKKLEKPFKILQNKECKSMNNDLQEKIKLYIKELKLLESNYNELNRKSDNEYDWRIQGLSDQISILEDLLEEGTKEIKDWKIAYQEDLEEYETQLKNK